MRPKTNMAGGAVAAAALGLMAGCAGQPAQLAATPEPAASQECAVVTGSRIAPEARHDCKPVGYPFRSYSAQDLEATGHMDLADALRSIDPAFR